MTSVGRLAYHFEKVKSLILALNNADVKFQKIKGVLWKKVCLEISQNSQENTYVRISFLIKLQAQVCNFIKKETPAKMFSYEFCGISKNTFFTEHLWTTASEVLLIICNNFVNSISI